MANDTMRFILASQEVTRNMRYDISMSVFTVPAAFSLDFGTRRSIGEMAAAFPPNTPFELKCEDTPLFTGFTDGVEGNCDSGGSTISFFGRDPLGKLISNDVPHDIHVSGKTYYDLFEYALKQNGFENPTIMGTNETNRIIQSGSGKSTKVTVSEQDGVLTLSPDTAQVIRGTKNGTFSVAPSGNRSRYEVKLDEASNVLSLQVKTAISDINAQVVAKTGNSWFEFIRSYFDKAGLFVWCGAKGEFIISRPDIHQKPLYRLLRLYNSTENNIISGGFRYDCTDMHAYCNVYGRAGGTKGGRLTMRADAKNDEMIKLGYNNIRSAKDDKISSQQHASDLARRKLSEEARKGITFKYQVKNHKTPLIGGGTGVWVPDTIVELVDEEAQINGAFYISAVKYTRDARNGTKTELTLLRPNDIVFTAQE